MWLNQSVASMQVITGEFQLLKNEKKNNNEPLILTTISRNVLAQKRIYPAKFLFRVLIFASL